MAAWTTPKTNWKSTDYINIEDYNRWIDNLTYIKDLATQIGSSFSIVDMGNHKNYEDLIYAEEINAIESNLTTICNNTYPFVIGTERTYYANQKTLDYAECNRIESAELLICENLEGQLNGLRHLAFTLGGGKIQI